MNLTDLRTMLDYHYWARDRLLEVVEPLTPEQFTRDLGSSFKSIRDTLAHLHAAEWAWHSRWNGVSPTGLLPADRFSDVAAVRAAWVEIEDEIRGFVKSGMAHFKVPRYVRFVDAFPQTVTGKIQKFKIRDQMIADLKLDVQKMA